MHQPIYRQIIHQAWMITWRNKFLWVFGFFAAFLINGGVYDVVVKMLSRTTWLSVSWQELTQDPLSSIPLVNDLILKNINLSSAGYIALAIFIILFALIFICLSVIGQGSLIFSVQSLLIKKKINKNVIDVGLLKFWPMFGINILLKVALFLLVIFITFPLALLLSQSILLNTLLHLVSYLVFIPLAIIFYLMAILAGCYVVLRKKKILTSIALAWDLFRRNWLICLELGFLLFVISFLIGLAMLLVVLVFSVPIILLFLAALALQSEVAYLVILFLSIFIIFVIVILGGSFMAAFQYSSWVLLFERLTTKGGFSRLVRWVGQLAGLGVGKPMGKKKPARRTKK
ncbi:hypothetical protein KJ969_03915 [Patescibacteria group bacterium]|nr:hypothetical protein [Patescibacteria group bacterium]MBU1921761.1 hypothetical protein [Patescibacteria group bacterium]